MSIFDKAKQGVDVAKFKADQLLRVNKVQNEIGALRREVLGVREKIAEAVVQLHKQSPLTYLDVEELCQKIDLIEAQIAEKDAQVAMIRAELPPGAAVALAGAALASQTVPCPQCQAALPIEAAFCSNCGYKIPPRPKCASCGFILSSDAAFCPNCGTKVAAPAPETAKPSVPNSCANCGFGLSADAMFCPNCGQRVEPEKPIEAAPQLSATAREEPSATPPVAEPQPVINEPDPNKCKNCGFVLSEDAVFCPDCGTAR